MNENFVHKSQEVNPEQYNQIPKSIDLNVESKDIDNGENLQIAGTIINNLSQEVLHKNKENNVREQGSSLVDVAVKNDKSKIKSFFSFRIFEIPDGESLKDEISLENFSEDRIST